MSALCFYDGMHVISDFEYDWFFQKEASQLHANGEQFAEMQKKILELGKVS